KIKVQGFAIWVDLDVKSIQPFDLAMEQISLFYNEILTKHEDIKLIKDWQDIHQLKEDEMGAILTLEGVEPIGHDMTKLNILYELGVRSVGLTWNHANLAADGALEPRGAGLTTFGKEIILFLNEKKMLTDVSH